jgi:hypothetical protein
MDPSRPDRILHEWDEVAAGARRPATPPKRVGVRSLTSGTSLAGAGILLAAVLIVAVWLGRPGANGGVGAVVSPLPSATPVPTVTASPTAEPTATAAPTATPAPTAAAAPTATLRPTVAPTPGPCDPSALAARITAWGGAAGNRIADVELTNAGPTTCTLRAMDRPQLVDGKGSVLIDGPTPTGKTLVTIAPGDVVTTMVSASNYCGPAASPPVSVAFVLSGGGRIVATPLSSTDATVPPCNGAGSRSTISMHPWAR